MNTPVALFAFNRAGALKESLAALSCCIGAEATDLYIFIDGPRTADERKKTDAVRCFITGDLTDPLKTVPTKLYQS